MADERKIILIGDAHLGLQNFDVPVDAPLIVGDHDLQGGTNIHEAFTVLDSLFRDRDRGVYTMTVFDDMREELRDMALDTPGKYGWNERGKAPIHMRHERESITKFQGGSRKKR